MAALEREFASLSADLPVEEASLLRTAFDELEAATRDLAEAEAELARQESLQEAVASAGEGTASVKAQTDALGLSDFEAVLLDVEAQRTSALGLASSPEEVTAVNEAFDRWVSAVEDFYEKQAEIDTAESFRSALESARSLLGNFNSDRLAASMSGRDYDAWQINQQRDEVLSGGSYNDAQVAELNRVFDEWIKANDRYYDELASEGRMKFYSSLDTSTPGYSDSRYSEGNTAAQAAYSSAMQSAMAAWVEYAATLEKTGASAEFVAAEWEVANVAIVQAAQDAADEAAALAKADFWSGMGDSAMASLGEVGELITSITDAVDLGVGAWGGLLGILVNLVSETEAFTALGSLLTDSIVPVLNAFLEPMLPMLEMLSSLLQTLFYGVIAPAFPILKTISWMLTLVFGLVNVAVGFIVDSFKWLAGQVMYGITSFINGVIGLINMLPFVNIRKIDNSGWDEWRKTDVFGNAEDRLDEMNDSLKAIEEMSMEIADNTSDKTDISDLEKVYGRGLISGSEFEALVAEKLGTDYKADDIVASSSQYIQNQGSVVNVSYGDVSIEINGFSGDAKTLAKEVKKVLEKSAQNPTFDLAI